MLGWRHKRSSAAVSSEGFEMYVNGQKVSLVELIRVSFNYREKLFFFQLLIKGELELLHI